MRYTAETTHQKGTILDGMGMSVAALIIGFVLCLCLAPYALAVSDESHYGGVQDAESVQVVDDAAAVDQADAALDVEEQGEGSGQDLDSDDSERYPYRIYSLS